MSTQTRRRVRRLEHAPKRNRDEVIRAVASSVGVVLFTIFGVWVLRPGGIAGRQPRAAWLVTAVLVAVVVIVALAVRPETTPRQRKTWVPTALVVVMILGLTVWLAWPGGIVRSYPSTEPPPDLDLEEILSQTSVPADTAPAVSNTTAAEAELDVVGDPAAEDQGNAADDESSG